MYNYVEKHYKIQFYRRVVTDRVDASQMHSQLPGRLESGISAFHARVSSTTLWGTDSTFFPQKIAFVCHSVSHSFFYPTYVKYTTHSKA